LHNPVQTDGDASKPWNDRSSRWDKLRAVYHRVDRWLAVVAAILLHGFLALALAWGICAIHFLGLHWLWSAAFAAVGIWSLWLARSKAARFVFPIAFIGVAMMTSSIRPSHDRHWRREVAVMPRAIINGDQVRLLGVRDFIYRQGQNDFTPHYENRDVSMSHLTGVDFFISYWMPGPVAHTFVSFVFDDAPPLSVSIEARPEEHEGYSPLGSLFNQFELIYVVGEERDLVGVRTNHRGEDVFLYRVRMSPEFARELFLVYLSRINELAERPEFYHLLANSCTVNIVRYAGVAYTPLPFDIRFYLNGLSDRFLYRTGRLQAGVPFQELRRRAHINELARAAGSEVEFSEAIRSTLPAPEVNTLPEPEE
jgi:hypothetical protein